MTKKGGDFEIIALDFLENIFKDLGYAVVRKRTQNSGSQDGYDNLIEVIDSKYKSYYIYSECKDYTTELNYIDALIKLPQLASTHENIDLAVFISPKKNFSNIFEETRNKPFLERLNSNNYPVAFISPETNVMEYFSLYPDLYKKVYLYDAPDIHNDEKSEILNKFEKYIFSDRNLKKVIIDDSDKEKYIGNLKKNSFHIERTVRTSQNRELHIPKGREENKALKNSIKESKKIGSVLLGSAGYGKSSELKNLAVDLWKVRNENDLIPVFSILKNFNVNSKIEDILPLNFKYISNLLVILDGVDEIENIIDFTNKLKEFILKNTKSIERFGMKFLISCRTNVYKKYIKNIDNFDICFLNEVSQSSAYHFFYNKYSLDLLHETKFDYWKHRELLENPFYLELIGKYFQNHKIILTNKTKLIDEYVNLRLNEDEKEKYRNDVNFDRDKIISYTQKAALALEAIQKPHLTSSEIKRVINIDEKEFSKNPFLEQNLDETWSFEHKNIQEYFVAKVLQSLPFNEIIKFIQIDADLNKVHPTWYNVISFLLNLDLPIDVYESLIDWLLLNDYELLFNADITRISDDIKSRLLQHYFIKNCEEDTLWIDDARQIANFSQSEQNIKFLLSKVQDLTIHRRARMSAIKLLNYTDIPDTYNSQIKEIIIDILKEIHLDDDYIYLKQESIELISSLKLNEDSIFFDKVIFTVGVDDNKEIISALLRSVPIKSFENSIDYFLEILDKTLGNKTWVFKARYNSITSTKELLFALFTKINNPDILIKIYKFLIDRHKNDNIKESLIADFLNHIKAIFKDKLHYHKVLIKIISNAVIKDSIRYFEDDLLIDLVKSCDIATPVFTSIFNSIEGNSSNKHFLADIVEENHFNMIVDSYKASIVDDDFIREFKNVISHRNLNLSIRFEEIIEQYTNYRFKEKIDIKKIEERTAFWKTENQRNFDVLFNSEELENQMIKIFEHYKTNELSFKTVDKFYEKYYSNFNLQKQITSNAKHILFEILRGRADKLKIEDLTNEIKLHELNIMEHILHNLPKDEKSNFIISDSQIDFIKKWCIKQAETLNVNYFNYILTETHWHSTEYFLFKLVYDFQKKFKFALDKTLLLNMLWFNRFEDGVQLEYIKNLVDIEEINSRIKNNLITHPIEPVSFCNYVDYCIANHIDLSILKIDFKKTVYEFLKLGNYYNASHILEVAFKKDESILTEFLNYKEVEKNRREFLRNVITILLDNKKNDIVETFLIANHSSLIDENLFNEFEIIRYLVNLNNSIAFEKLHTLIFTRIQKSEFSNLEFRNEWQTYSNKKGIEDLIKIFELYLITQDSEKLFDRFSTPVRISSDTLINICKNHDTETCTEVLEKMKKIDLEKIKTAGGDIFFYNRLRNDILEIYYSHKSKPYSFIGILKFLEEEKNLFVS